MSLKEKMTALADAVRNKAELTDTLTIDEMTEAVNSLVVNGVEVDERTLSVTPSKSQQTFTSSDLGENAYYGTVTVAPIPSEYITTDDATALFSDILSGKTAYVNGTKVTGGMTDYGDVVKKFDNISNTLHITANGYFKSIEVTLTKKELTVTPSAKTQYFDVFTDEENDVFYSKVTVDPIPSEYITTTDATAGAEHVLEGKTAYVNGQKVTGVYEPVSEEDVRYGVSFGVAYVFEGSAMPLIGSFTGDATATSADIASGKIAYVKGEKVTGTASGTSDATVTDSDLLEGVTAYGKDGKITGTMPFSTFEFNSGTFTVSRGYTEEDSVYDLPLLQHSIVRDNVVLVTEGYNNEAVEIAVGNAIEGGFFIPGTSDIVIPAQSYLLNNYVIMGDEDLRPENIKSGVTIFNLTGTFTSDADAAASDIAEGKTAYVKGEKVIGTAGGGSVSPLWTCEYRNFMTGYPPCNTTQTPTRTQQGWHAFDGKLYNGNSYINKTVGPDINWTYACTRHYPNHNTCLAIGDGKLYFVGTDVVCLTPDLTGVTQVMEGDNGRYFFLCGEDIYLSLSEANTYKKVEGIKVSKILNQRMFSYEPCVMVITTTGDLAEVSCEYDSDVGAFSVKWEANGDPFINYFYVSPEEMVSGGMGYLGGYEFAIRSSGLLYRKISESTSNSWIKPENAPDLIPTNWLGYCSTAAEEKEEYDPETDEYRLYYELKEETLALHIDKDGALWAMRANATLSGDDFDPDFQLNGVTFERIGEDNDWQCVPPIPPFSDISKTGYAQKGGKLVLMWTTLVDGKLVVNWTDEVISPSGRLLGCYESCCFFAPAGVTVDMSRAGGTY